MKKILAIDGGGIKGVFSAAYLAELENGLKGKKPYEFFDIIAGTSTGGIIAAALALGIPANDILDLYLSNGNTIFTPKSSLFSLFNSKYSSDNLKNVLASVFGDKRIKDCKTRLLLPAFNIETGSFRVFKTQHHEQLFFDGKEKIVNCLMATTAAPTYFLPVKGNRGTYIDGGVGANNPSLLGVVEALSKCGWELNELSLLNIGGIDTRPTRGNERMALKDIKAIINCFMAAETQIAKNSCSLLLGERYKCVDYMPNRVIRMDNASDQNLRELETWGRHRALEDVSVIDNVFFSEAICPPKFYNQ